MIIFIDGEIVNNKSVYFNDGLNFGRFNNTSVPIPFELHIDKLEFIEQLEAFYNKTKDEVYQDDNAYNDTSCFTNTNYCSLSELLNFPKGLQEIFINYLDKAFYRKSYKTTMLFNI